MHTLDISEKDTENLYQLFMECKNSVKKKKLLVIYLKALNLPHYEIARIARVSDDSVTRYIVAYSKGGLDEICKSNMHKPKSALAPHIEEIKNYFKKNPPNTVSQASHEIHKLTQIKLSLSGCREFLINHLGMKCRKVGTIPSKADPDRQEEFLKKDIEPLLKEEQEGKRKVFFVDAAHFVMGAFPTMIWCFQRVFLRSSSGRKRYNVLGAYSLKGEDLILETNDAYINADSILNLIDKIIKIHPDKPVSLVMDNAKYQKCIKVSEAIKGTNISILFLPPYSPNLNLIERLWKFVKKQCLYNKYYEDFSKFKKGINDCLLEVGGKFKEDIKSLITPNFQLFKKDAIVTV